MSAGTGDAAGYRGTLCSSGVSLRCQQIVQVKVLSGRLDIACCLGDRSRLAAKAGRRLQRDHLVLWASVTSGHEYREDQGKGLGPAVSAVRDRAPGGVGGARRLFPGSGDEHAGDGAGCSLAFVLPTCRRG